MNDAANDDQRREKVRAMVRDIRNCMFTTLDAQGAMRARPMAAISGPGEDDTIWFFTRADSPKADEIGADGHVLLSFSGPSNAWLSLSGHAEVMRDVEKQKALWSEMARLWFPKGPESEEMTLIAFHPDRAEYWDSPSGALLFALGYVKAMLSGRVSEVGGNEKVAFTG